MYAPRRVRDKKYLLLASLPYAVMVSLNYPSVDDVRARLLRHWCHRTAERGRDTPAPLYRLRSALSRLV
jgi:hypothetical protein